MKSTKKNKTKIALLSIGSVLLAAIMVLSGLGIYFKITHKKDPAVEVNPLDFSTSAWDGKTVEATNFNENFAGRGIKTKTINSASSFVHFINEVNSGSDFGDFTVYLNSNIDLVGYEIDSIGSNDFKFKGTFDGGHYTIFNAKINGNSLFENIENATIKNVGLYNCSFKGENNALIGTATNSNLENTFVRLGNAKLVNNFISNNGEHSIKNSFVDSSAQGLVGTINTNSSAENAVTIENSYFTQGDKAILAGDENVLKTNVVKATNKSDFANFNYSSEYATDSEWCDYDYLAGSNKLDFVYPLQAGFVKVYLTGSCYESVMVAGDTVVDTTNLAEAFEKADKESEAEINLLVEKIFMEARAEAENNSKITVNAVKNTTIVRGENNTDSMFVAAGSSKITIGNETENVGSMSTRSSVAPTITLDGNREYIEANNLESGALIVSYGAKVDIKDNVIIKDSVNNNVKYGGAVLLFNTSAKANVEATFENCHAEKGGGAVAIIGSQVGKLGSFKNCSSNGYGGAVYIAPALPTEDTEAVRTINKLYGNNSNIMPMTGVYETGDYEIADSGEYSNLSGTVGGAVYIYGGNLTISGSPTFTSNCADDGGPGGAIYCTGTVTITGSPTFTYNSTDSAYGGAIGAEGDIIISNDDVTFEENSASTFGGAIYASGEVIISAAVNFNGNVVTKGSGDYGGGAIYASKVTITGDATFIANNVQCIGGAIYATVDVKISGDCQFIANETMSDSGYELGGAIYAGGNVEISGDSEFDSNISNYCGGAIYAGYSVTITGSPTFKNHTSCSDYGGAICAGSIGEGTVTFGIFSRATFEENSAPYGIIYNWSDGGVVIEGSPTFENNESENGIIRTDYDVTISGNPTFKSNTGVAISNMAMGTVIISGKPVFKDNNNDGSNGGAIYTSACDIQSTAEVTFKHNSANNGGAIYCEGDLTIAGKVIFDNNMATAGSGGAVYICYGKINISGEVDFINNQCSGDGGAIYRVENAGFEFSGNVNFTKNSATGNGGAICVGSINISGGVTFDGNTSGSNGGAIYSRGYVTISGDCDFVENEASRDMISTEEYLDVLGYGGAIYAMSLRFDKDVTVNFINNKATVIYDSAKNCSAIARGGAIYTTSDLDLSGNLTFSGNQAMAEGVDEYEMIACAEGGAVYSTGAVTISNNCTFDSNVVSATESYTDTSSGGAICASSNVTISSVATFKDNSAIIEYNDTPYSIGGGAIYSSNITIEATGDVTFTGNTASRDGGALNAPNTATIAGNATFKGNTASRNGGAICSGEISGYAEDGYGNIMIEYDANVVLENNTGTNGEIYFSNSMMIFSEIDVRTTNGTPAVYIPAQKSIDFDLIPESSATWTPTKVLPVYKEGLTTVTKAVADAFDDAPKTSWLYWLADDDLDTSNINTMPVYVTNLDYSSGNDLYLAPGLCVVAVSDYAAQEEFNLINTNITGYVGETIKIPYASTGAITDLTITSALASTTATTAEAGHKNLTLTGVTAGTETVAISGKVNGEAFTQNVTLTVVEPEYSVELTQDVFEIEYDSSVTSVTIPLEFIVHSNKDETLTANMTYYSDFYDGYGPTISGIRTNEFKSVNVNIEDSAYHIAAVNYTITFEDSNGNVVATKTFVVYIDVSPVEIEISLSKNILACDETADLSINLIGADGSQTYSVNYSCDETYLWRYDGGSSFTDFTTISDAVWAASAGVGHIRVEIYLEYDGGSYYVGMAEMDVTVVNAFLTLPTENTAIYTGSAITMTPGNWADISSGATVTSTETDAGTYTVTASLNDGYIWEDGTYEDKTFTFTILPKKLETPVISVTYAGTAFVVSWDEVVGATSYTVNVYKEGTAFSTQTITNTYYPLTFNSAGGYTCTVTATSDNSNYLSSDASILSDDMHLLNCTLEAGEGIASISGSTTFMESNGRIYNGDSDFVIVTLEENYVFTGWTASSNNIEFATPAELRTEITANYVGGSHEVTITANAKFNGYKVNFGVNVEGYGTVSHPDGIVAVTDSEISVNGRYLTIGDQEITAIPTDSTAEYTYSFTGWSGIEDAVTHEMLIVANFERIQNIYTLTFALDERYYGTVVFYDGNDYYTDGYQLEVPYGTRIEFIGDTCYVGSTMISAQGAGGDFDYWLTSVNGFVDHNATITAMFCEHSNDDLEKINFTIKVNNPEYGLLILYENDDSTTIVGKYSEISVTTERYCYISMDAAVDEYEFDLFIGTSVNPYPINVETATNTEHYTYNFVGFFMGGVNIADSIGGTDDYIRLDGATIEARFERIAKEYTVTFASNNTDYGTVSVDSIVAEYDTAIHVSDNVITINSNACIAYPTENSAQYEYQFTGWTISSETVSGDMTVTANFTRVERTYTVTVVSEDENKGTIAITGTPGAVAWGTVIKVEDNVITIGSITYTATGVAGYKFDKWLGIVGSVNGNITIAAVFEKVANVNVGLSVASGVGGTLSASALNVPYGSSVTVSGNTLTIGETTITATPAEGYAFKEWQNVPATATENMNIIAVFEEAKYTISFSGWEHESITVKEGTVIEFTSSYDLIVGGETINSFAVIYTIAIQDTNGNHIGYLSGGTQYVVEKDIVLSFSHGGGSD